MTQHRERTYWLTAWILCLNSIAGFVNVVSLVYFEMPTTHYTGHMTQFALHLARGNVALIGSVLFVVVSFLGGSMLSGYLFSDKVFQLKKRYGVVLLGLGMMHCLLVSLFNGSSWLIGANAFMAGVQNGLFIFYRGMIVRSTHFTGYLTDIGFELGRMLRGLKDSQHKVAFYSTSIACFIIGGILATWLYARIGSQTLYVISASYMLAGSYYLLFRQRFYT